MYRNITNDKIGNILRFLSSKIDYLSLTKTLKLLYLIDEISVKETGVPTTWLDYKAWKMGPVAPEIYDEIKYGKKDCYNGVTYSLDEYVQIERINNTERNQEEIYLKSKGGFYDGIFSDYEIDLFDRVIKKYGHLTSTELIDLLHSEGSLYDNVVKREDLENNFELLGGKSNVSLNFQELVKGAIKSMALKAAYESLDFQFQSSNSY